MLTSILVWEITILDEYVQKGAYDKFIKKRGGGGAYDNHYSIGFFFFFFFLRNSYSISIR